MTTEVQSAADPKPNPSLDSQAKDLPRRKRIPMSVPQQRLQVPEIPGYHLHWFKESNVPRALAAYYEPVGIDEVPVHQRGVATHNAISGSQDLGTGVKIISGVTEFNHAEYLVLMKLRQEYWDEDRAEIDRKNADRMGAIFRNEQILNPDSVRKSGQTADDKALQYVSAKMDKPLFNRPTRKAQIIS